MLPIASIECISVIDGKTYAIDKDGKHYRLKMRLYELESILPSFFIRINKSSLANEVRLDRFQVTYAGSVDAVFKCGYREYVSRIYIVIYLINGWLKQQLLSLLIFTGIFIAGYAVIWLLIYYFTKAKAEKINRMLRQ